MHPEVQRLASRYVFDLDIRRYWCQWKVAVRIANRGGNLTECEYWLLCRQTFLELGGRYVWEDAHLP